MPISMPESVWALEGFWVEGGEAFSPFNETVELALLIKQWEPQTTHPNGENQ